MSVATVVSSDTPAPPNIPQPGSPGYEEWVNARNEIIEMNRKIAILQAKTNASRNTVKTLGSLTCLAGYHQESSKIMLDINLVMTFLVAVGSILTRTEEAAMVSLFAYLPVIVLAILQLRVSIAVNSRAHIAVLQWYSIASFMFAGISMLLRIYGLIVDRHHGKHVLDIVVLVLQVCEMIISIVILVGADQEGFALGQISRTVAHLHDAELVQSDTHQRHADALASKSVWVRTRSFTWFVVTAPVRRAWRWLTRSNARPKTD